MIKNLRKLLLIALPIILLFSSIGLTSAQEPDPTATPLLIPTEYTEDLFKDNYQEFLNSIKNDGITEKTIILCTQFLGPVVFRPKPFNFTG